MILCNFFYCNDWQHITSNLNVTDIIADYNKVHASTNGGLIVLDRNSESLSIYNSNNGITPTDLNSVYIDSNKNILLGSNGPRASIQMLDSNYNNINTVFLDGISGVSQIIEIIEFNSNIYAIGRGSEFDRFIEFRFDSNGQLYYQTVINSFPIQNISTIYDIDIENSDSQEIFITTNKGVVKGTIINDEVVWDIFNEIDLDQSFFNNGDIFSSQFREEIVIDIINSPNSDYFNIMTNKSIYNVANADTIKIFDCPYDLASLSNIDLIEETIVLSIENMGFYSLVLDGNSVIDKSMYLPETILQNRFTAITVIDNDDVVAISQNGGTILSSNKIINFVPYNNKNYYPVNNHIDNNANIDDYNRYGKFKGFSTNYRSSAQSPMSIINSDWNSVYFANSGITPDIDNPYNSPLVEISLDNYECLNYGIGDTIIDGMDGIVDIESEDSNYMFINYLDKDSQGNIWVLNPYAEYYNNIIAIQTDKKDWYHFKDSYGLNISEYNNSLLPTSFDFGPSNKVWISFKKHTNQNGEVVSSGGIKILDYNNTINDFSDDNWLEVSNPDIFPDGADTDIWSVAFSKNLDEDILWILTGSGIKGYIVNNLELIEYPQTFYESISFDEFDKLKVDSQNNLWIITRHSGVRVISQDTSVWPGPEGITVQNSPILSDIVYDVAFNQNNGKIYFATEKGISIFQSPFTRNPYISNDEILLSPNPLKLSDEKSLSIWNLFPGSKIRIMTLDGTVLKTFQLNENENRINLWDGMINNGNYISSGIYLITASHPDYKSRIGKLAVIK